jgi:hypothetical protein
MTPACRRLVTRALKQPEPLTYIFSLLLAGGSPIKDEFRSIYIVQGHLESGRYHQSSFLEFDRAVERRSRRRREEERIL